MHTKQEFIDGNSWGLSAAIDLRDCDPDIIRNADSIKQFVVELCDLIEVKRFGECTVVHFGERDEIAGFSMTQLIETSLVSGHFVNLTNSVFLDVFSCKHYELDKVVEKAKTFFKAGSVEYNYLIRK